MDSGRKQSHVGIPVGSGDAAHKVSPERCSTKSNSTSSSNSAIGGHDHKMPFLIGVAGGTASGKVTLLICLKSTYD